MSASPLTTFRNTQWYNTGVVVVTGSFLPNGSSALVATGVVGAGFSVAYTTTGTYTITLNDSFLGLLSAQASIAMSSATDLTPQWGAIDVVTAKTLVLRANAGATPTDIAANAANRIYFTLFLDNSVTTP